MLSHKSALFLSIVIISPAFLLSASPVSGMWLIDGSGTLVQVESQVLGRQADVRQPATVSGEDGAAPTFETVEPALGDSRQRELDNRQEQVKRTFETQVEARRKQLNNLGQERKSKIEVSGRQLRVKQELRSETGRVVSETETELSESESLSLEHAPGELLEISPGSDGQLEVRGERVRTRTHFPLSIGADNELIITKKDGTEKVVTVLPDAAVARLEQKGFTSVAAESELSDTEDGTAVYQLAAEEEKRILGLFRRKFRQSVSVSVETGEILNVAPVASEAWERWLEKFSF